MGRVKPTEVRLVGDLIDQALDGADEVDVDELARAVIVALDEKRAGDRRFAAVAYIPLGDGGVWKGFGPYTTPKQARTAALGQAAPGPRPGVARVVELTLPEE